MRRTFLSAAAFLCAATAAQAQDAKTPDFTGLWGRAGVAYDKPASGPGPVMNTLDSGQVWVGDTTNPILKPETAEIIRKNGELDQAWFADLSKPHDATHPFVVNRYTAQQTCWPSGVPGMMTIPAASIQFLQTPKQVAILYERDHFTRIVYMNQPHSAHPAPSWFGESVGHYEGDTLVVDTIGFNGKSAVDRFGSPSSEKLHVIERFHVAPGRRMLQVDFTVDDPEVFTMPWSAVATYRRNNNPAMEEVVCAEGNFDVTQHKDFPIPMQN